MKNEILETLKKERTSYAEMMKFCCDSMILNNDIISELSKKDFYFDIYCGEDYDEESVEYREVYQYYIISGSDAERLADFTNELVYFNEELDLYILGVTHWGTSWEYVAANWKEEE
jgi:hypothetical protein